VSDRLPKDKYTADLEKLLEGFRELLEYYSPSCLTADASCRNNVMSSVIRPIFPTKISGPALTIKIDPQNCFSPIEIIKHIKPGQILVVDAGGETELSVVGGVISSVLKQKGVVGAVVDGAVRDIDEVKDMRFPLFSRSVVPRSSLYFCKENDKTKPIEANVPVRCGGVLVHPGDIIVADESGVTVVPSQEAETVLNKAKEIAKKEGELTKKIKGKIDIEEILEMTRKVVSSQ
jgi:4-hydroxy-4-methyl-2-oxoglutarate aldolase